MPGSKKVIVRHPWFLKRVLNYYNFQRRCHQLMGVSSCSDYITPDLHVGIPPASFYPRVISTPPWARYEPNKQIVRTTESRT